MKTTITHPEISMPTVNKLDEKVILFKGTSQYDVLRIFIDDLAKGFEALGYETVVLDVSVEPDILQKLSTIEGTIRCFVSFNGVGIGLKFQNQPIYDALSIPLITWYVDHPFYHKVRIEAMIDCCVTIISNENNYNFFLQEYRKPKTVTKCIQVGGCQHVENIIPYDEREHGLVFFGSYLDNLDNYAKQLDFANKRLRQLVWDTIECAKFETHRELSEIFYDLLISFSIDPNDLPKDNVMVILSVIDEYVRIFRRRYIFHALKDIPVTVFGNGWEHYDQTKENNITFKPALGFTEATAIMANSRLVLNVMPNNKTGIHDRLAYAMHQGTACLSEYTPGLGKSFTDGKDIFFYEITPALQDTLKPQVEAILSNPDKMATVSAAGKENVGKHFNWTSRAQEIADLADSQDVLGIMTRVDLFEHPTS